MNLIGTKLVLFDIDGTLIRTGGAGVLSFEHTFRTLFQVTGATESVQLAGRTDTSILRELFARASISPSPENFAECFGAYVFWLDHLLQQLPGRVLPGIDRFLAAAAALPSGPPAVGLLTGNIRLGAEIKLRHFGLWDHFVTGAFGDDHEDRNCLAGLARDRGARLLGTPLGGQQILVIGDTPHDIACGQSIGAKTLAVATGPFSREELARYHPTWAVECLDEFELP